MRRRDIVRSLTAVAFVLGSSAALNACVATVHTRPIDLGSIETPGVVIHGPNNSFTYRSGEHFRPARNSRCYRSGAPQISADALVTSAGTALQLGAEHVTVEVPGRERPLNGLLLLCDVPLTATGPASRSYRIVVPESYVQGATGGRMSAVFERVDHTNHEGAAVWYFAWVLWLSDEPIR